MHVSSCGSDEIHVLFGRIDDFEFTRECAIFDLLDIPLYHGWIVDPQVSVLATFFEFTRECPRTFLSQILIAKSIFVLYL